MLRAAGRAFDKFGLGLQGKVGNVTKSAYCVQTWPNGQILAVHLLSLLLQLLLLLLFWHLQFWGRFLCSTCVCVCVCVCVPARVHAVIIVGYTLMQRLFVPSFPSNIFEKKGQKNWHAILSNNSFAFDNSSSRRRCSPKLHTSCFHCSQRDDCWRCGHGKRFLCVVWERSAW